MISPNVTIIILNWNGWEDTIECLESLYQINYSNFDVIVLDNNSRDESWDKIKDYAQGKLEVKPELIFIPSNKSIEVVGSSKSEYEKIKDKEEYRTSSPSKKFVFIRNDSNYGFAEGNNIGIRYALNFLNPHYILLLNNDTVVDKDFLIEMIKFAETNSNYGIIGPKIYYYDFPNKFQVTRTKINFWKGQPYLIGDSENDIGQYDEIQETDSVPGSCFLIKKEVIRDVGLFNPKFQCYWEESDYCMSAINLGYKCFYFPESKIWHKTSKSINKTPGMQIYYMTRNMFYFMKRQSTTLQYTVFLSYFFGIKFWYIIILFLYQKNLKNITFFLSGIFDGLK